MSIQEVKKREEENKELNSLKGTLFSSIVFVGGGIIIFIALLLFFFMSRV